VRDRDRGNCKLSTQAQREQGREQTPDAEANDRRDCTRQKCGERQDNVEYQK
jgi:hypothetical protein